MLNPTNRRRFLTIAGLGAGAVAAAAVPATAADPTAAEQATLKVVTDFCAAWATRDLTRILPFLSDDCVYRMTETTAPVNGHQGVSDRLKQWLVDASLVEFKILDAKVSGPIVITHRIDRFLTKQPLTWEGVGVFFVKDGKIKEWSDYTIRVQR
jgi:limonene-1,2-epoxide hydrolase